MTRTWSKCSSQTLLREVWHHAIILENGLAAAYKLTVPKRSSNFTQWYFPRRNENIRLHKDSYTVVVTVLFVTPKMGWWSRGKLWYIHTTECCLKCRNKVSLRFTEQTTDTHSNVDKSQKHYAKWKKSCTKEYTVFDVNFTMFWNKENLSKVIKIRPMVAWDKGWE